MRILMPGCRGLLASEESSCGSWTRRHPTVARSFRGFRNTRSRAQTSTPIDPALGRTFRGFWNTWSRAQTSATINQRVERSEMHLGLWFLRFEKSAEESSKASHSAFCTALNMLKSLSGVSPTRSFGPDQLSGSLPRRNGKLPPGAGPEAERMGLRQSVPASVPGCMRPPMILLID